MIGLNTEIYYTVSLLLLTWKVMEERKMGFEKKSEKNEQKAATLSLIRMKRARS